MFYFFVNRRRTVQLDLVFVAPKLRTEALYRLLLLLFSTGQADDGIGAFLILGHQRLLTRGVVSSDLRTDGSAATWDNATVTAD